MHLWNAFSSRGQGQGLQGNGKEKAWTLRTRSQHGHTEQHMMHFIHACMGQLFIEHLLCPRKRAKEQVGKDENQEVNLGLPIQQESIHPQPLRPKEGTHTPKLPPFEV